MALHSSILAPISKATWVQWLFRWDATPGEHVLGISVEHAVQEENVIYPAMKNTAQADRAALLQEDDAE